MEKQLAGAAALISMSLFLTACSSTPRAATSAIPDNLVTPPTQALTVTAQASGVQIYQCAASAADAGKFAWRFIAPEADLFDNSGNKIGKHYAGPTWEALDGSKVVGAVLAQNPGPDANAIPWLLLGAQSHSGDGAFAGIQSAQRLNTVGGKALENGCNQDRLGQQVRIAYQAQYRFYSAK
ncbi:hypothetical protein CAter282_0197 [Collimonas arenae]|uniref:DUF3455 domain-containing protein n=1 Tax=Collimonas arenae TaxID=279058 RepID=A0A127QDE1_9BURK|nr:DUF3455 domain-containing protein [Collimonas arenae]AMO98152.1 hypothetical protein CAter10_0209 [Collimonas arenae]AMP08021.1 hypothetical protein CAter282_0197 [Collimonas arenae]